MPDKARQPANAMHSRLSPGHSASKPRAMIEALTRQLSQRQSLTPGTTLEPVRMACVGHALWFGMA